MNFNELILKRQSVRRYIDKMPEREKIERIMEAARLAPSASNSQPWTFIVVDEPELKDKVAKATFSSTVSFNKFAVDAPIMIVMVIEKPKLITQLGKAIMKRDFPLIDIGIAAEHICLQAEEEGLGTCMLGWFHQREIRKLLNIPKSKNLGLLITMGYAEEDYKLREKIRKPYAEVVKYNSY